MSLVIFCLLFSFVDYVPVKGEIIWYLSLTVWLNSQVLEANERIKKTMVHLHNRILLSREKGAYTLHNSMDGTGEHYAK